MSGCTRSIGLDSYVMDQHQPIMLF